MKSTKLNVSFLLCLVFLLVTGTISAQTDERLKKREYKTMQRLYNMQWYKMLKENLEMIEGDPVHQIGAVYSYLEHVKNHPECVDVAQFQQAKMDYNAIVNRYNGVIDRLINEVNNLVEKPVSELHIDLGFYKQEYDQLRKDIPKFVSDLEKELVKQQGDCHRAASVVPIVDLVVSEIVIPIIDGIKRQILEQYKIIITQELEKLKLDPSSTWDEIELYLELPQQYVSVVTNQVEDVYHLVELDYCKLLQVAKSTCYEKSVILSRYEAQTAFILEFLSSEDQDQSSIEYYQMLLADYNAARDFLLEKCKDEPLNRNSGNSEEHDKLVNQLNLLMEMYKNDECIPVEMLERILN